MFANRNVCAVLRLPGSKAGTEAILQKRVELSKNSGESSVVGLGNRRQRARSKEGSVRRAAENLFTQKRDRLSLQLWEMPGCCFYSHSWPLKSFICLMKTEDLCRD